MSLSQFRITVFTQSRTDLLKHNKSIGPYGRQFDHSIKYLVSIQTSANPSLIFLTLSYPTRRTNPTPTHHTKPYFILRYSTILNLFIAHQYNLYIYKKNYPKLEYSTRKTLHHVPQCNAPYRTAMQRTYPNPSLA